MKQLKKCFSLLILLLQIDFLHPQMYQSLMTIQAVGTDFIPANHIELIATYQNIFTLLSCYQKCNFNPLCRTFVSDISSPFTCRLYEGSIDTGTISSSLSSTSQVGGIYYESSLYKTYNQSCDQNPSLSNRYLICNNGLWQCPTDSFWNGSMCLNKVYYQASCNTDLECREDIYLSCSSLCQKCLCQLTTIWNRSSSACGKHDSFTQNNNNNLFDF